MYSHPLFLLLIVLFLLFCLVQSQHRPDDEYVQKRPKKKLLLPLGVKQRCSVRLLQRLGCEIDDWIGNDVIYEDHLIRIWNVTIAPGDMTSLHIHDFDVWFMTTKPSMLQVWTEEKKHLFDYYFEDTIGFKLNAMLLIPIGVMLPRNLPTVHALKNIGNTEYQAILYESKTTTEVLRFGDGPPLPNDIDMDTPIKEVHHIEQKNIEL